MAQQNITDALHQLHIALVDGTNEDVKRKKIYPFFTAMFGEKFRIESEAEGSDIYIEGKLLVELKTDDWLAAFYQALHYQKKGLTFTAVCVIQNNFIALWKLKDGSLPDDAMKLAKASDAHQAPNRVGRANAKKTSKGLALEIFKSASFSWRPIGDLFPREALLHLSEWRSQLNNLDEDRIQVNTSNFLDCVEQMERFFPGDKMAAIHCFYAIVGAWDVTSTVNGDDSEEHLSVTSAKNRRTSEWVRVARHLQDDFRQFVEQRYIFTNEGSGLTTDFYFSRFDAVMSRVDPEYAKQHGIYFTDINLSKFAIWFVRTFYPTKLGDKYIVLDPAGGSGNLATSWKDHLKHKIVSELQSDLLKTIERRMRYDPDEVRSGYTIIPKTTENRGLNFLDQSAEAYYGELKRALSEANISFDKPLAFLLNPPYKNTDQNETVLASNDAAYSIDPKIVELTGEDAMKERYLAFLGQILRISQINAGELPGSSPIVMIFTPTSWLIPRPAYRAFRKVWDKYFKYEKGFLITSNEFFEVDGRWPLAFTLWRYNENEQGNSNVIDPRDYTFLKRGDLEIDWDDTLTSINQQIHELIDHAKGVKLSGESRGDIRLAVPPIQNGREQREQIQPRYDFSHAKGKQAPGEIVSGFPKGAKGIREGTDLHFSLKRTCGSPTGSFVGLYGDNTPVRVIQDSCNRMSLRPDRIWFRLDNDFKSMNLTRLMNAPPDNRGFCAYDLASAKALMTWFALTKAFNGKSPIWANQFDIWWPNISPSLADSFYAMCFAMGIAESRCLVLRFEKDNPVSGAPEIFLENALSPLNDESFLSTTLTPFIRSSQNALANSLLDKLEALYLHWSMVHCKGKSKYGVGLEEEPYFKYFASKDFITPNSGLVQIKRYAQVHVATDLLHKLDEIAMCSRDLKDEIFRMLTEDFRYFE